MSNLPLPLKLIGAAIGTYFTAGALSPYFAGALGGTAAAAGGSTAVGTAAAVGTSTIVPGTAAAAGSAATGGQRNSDRSFGIRDVGSRCARQ